MSFDQLGLCPEILAALEKKGYETPTPIQEKAIPVILEGRDVLGGAQTGTGKTAAFTLPILQKLSEKNMHCMNPRALIITPTRELAAQIGKNISDYSKNLDLEHAVVFGGVGMNGQLAKFKKGIDILVATPGRLLDHAENYNVELRDVDILVLDEADRMLDMGFLPDIKKILDLVSHKKQTLLFSATIPQGIKKLADVILDIPVSVEVDKRNTAAETVEQVAYMIEPGEKRKLLAHLVREGDWRQVLVFTRTKESADSLGRYLSREQVSAEVIHGDRAQSARTRVLAEFKKGKVRVLVATDVASRGLDISQLPYVINYELPSLAEDYIHRIGRTGRAGLKGQAISLVSQMERRELHAIEGLMKLQLRRLPLPEYNFTNNFTIIGDTRKSPFADEEERLEKKKRHQEKGSSKGKSFSKEKSSTKPSYSSKGKSFSKAKKGAHSGSSRPAKKFSKRPPRKK